MKGICAVLFLMFALHVSAQIQIEKPKAIPYLDQFDSIRIGISKFCLGDVVTQSKSKIDIRIFRWMAFANMKLIRISTSDSNSFQIDVYSITPYKDSLVYYKKINDFISGFRIQKLIEEYNILNIPDLDYDFISPNRLPIVYDGNVYYIEAKVNRDFTFKEFNNPEIYAKHFSDKAKQAKTFTDFIMKLEELTCTKIIEPDYYDLKHDQISTR